MNEEESITSTWKCSATLTVPCFNVISGRIGSGGFYGEKYWIFSFSSTLVFKPKLAVGFMNSFSSVALVAFSGSFYSFFSVFSTATFMIFFGTSSCIFIVFSPKLFFSSALLRTAYGTYFCFFASAGRCSNLSVTFPRSAARNCSH